MNNNTNTPLDFIRMPNLYRDIIMLFFGVFFIVLVYFGNFNNVRTYLKDYGVNNFSVEIDILILIIAYIFGRLFLVFSNLLLDIYSFFSVQISKLVHLKSIREYLDGCKAKHRKSIEFTGSGYHVSLGEMQNKITVVEKWSILDKSQVLMDLQERSLLYFVYLRCILVVSYLCVFIFQSYIYLIPFSIFLFLSIFTRNDVRNNDNLLFESAVKKIYANSERK